MSFLDKRFCVYLHLRKDNGKPFYVGQGTTRRPKQSGRKNKKWNEVVDTLGGFDVKIVEDSLTKDEAIELETFLIDWIGSGLVNNKHNSSSVKEMNFDDFNKRYAVDESSPTGLRYKEDVIAYRKSGVVCRNGAKAGDVAGTHHTDGYQICFNSKNYRVHRVVFLLVNGSIDKHKVIDHIDGNPFNNDVSNLREITQAENVRNRKKDKRNKTGVQGIAVKDDVVRVAITIHGIRYAEYFPIKKYGEDGAMLLAKEWRAAKELEAKALGYAYSDRHSGK